MKTLKRISFLAIAALFFAPTFQSCKKGEEDPGLSLRSRTARLAGEWTVTEMNQTATSENTNSSSGGSLSSGTSVEDYSFDGTALTIYSTNTSVNSGLTNTYKDTMVYDAVSMTYTIEKDGTFKSTNDMMATETNTYSWGTVTYTEEMVEEPTVEPTEEPTVEPTEEPTDEPTVEPTEEPTPEEEPDETAPEETVLEDATDKILGKFPTVRAAIVKLQTEDFKEFVESIDWISPRPTAFRVNLKNGQDYTLKWTGKTIIGSI